MTSAVRRATATLLVAVLTAATLVAVGSPAQALPGLVRVSTTSATDATSPKTVLAHCPPGTVTFSGGATIAGGDDARVRLTGLMPQSVSYRATASAGTAGYPGAWSLTAYAICAPRPVNLGGSSGFDPPGMSTQWYRSFRGGCPLGQQLIGFGAEVLDSSGNPATGVALQLLIPRPGLQEWVAQAYRIDADYRERWALYGTSRCADPISGAVLVTGGPVAVPSVATVSCPGGTQAHAIGGALSAAPGEVALTGLYPSTNLVDTLTFGEEIAGGASTSWQPRAYAICAP